MDKCASTPIGVVFVMHPVTRQSGEVNFMSLLRNWYRETELGTMWCDGIMVSDQVQEHLVYECHRGERTIIPFRTTDPRKG